MNKFLLFFLIAILGLSGCANNSDEPDPVEPPEPPTRVSEDDFIGTWEAYYSVKHIIANYQESNQIKLPIFRDISYDGFPTTFYKTADGKYRYTSKNAFGEFVEDNKYWVNKGEKIDTLKLESFNQEEDKLDTTVQVVQRLDKVTGYLKTDFLYYGRNKADGTKYFIRDDRSFRNTAISPNLITGVEKEKLDYEDMCNGSWEFEFVEIFIGGHYNSKESQLAMDNLKGLTYTFFTDPVKGRFSYYAMKDNPENGSSYPLQMVDDVFWILNEPVPGVFPPQYKKNAKTKNQRQSERLNNALNYIIRKSALSSEINSSTLQLKAEEEELKSWFIWVTELSQRKGASFVDITEELNDEDITKVRRTKYYMKRIQ